MKRPYKTNIFIATLGIIGTTMISAPVLAANTSNVDFSATLQSSTTITIPSAPIEIDLKPTGAGAFGSADVNVIVSTNQPGYTLTMATSSTDLESTTINPITNNYYAIPTLNYREGGYTGENFTANRWGIAIDGGNFNAVTTERQLKDTNTTANADATTISFGTNLDLQTAAGDYDTTITFTVTPKMIIPPEPSIIAEVATMQQFSTLSSTAKTSVVNSMIENVAYPLEDTRDGNIYNVAKLADGKVWMLDNLALDLTNSTVLNGLTASNTNATATSLGYLKNGGGAENSQYATDGVSNWTSDYSFASPLVNITNKDVVPNNAPTNGQGNNKVGGYYNYCAASAGSYCYGNGTSVGTSSGNATEDICPAGWRMPTGGSDGEYNELLIALTGNTSEGTYDEAEINAYRTALSLPLSGYFLSGSAGSQGSFGFFWSSTRFYEYDMYYLNVGTGGVGSAGGSDRGSGSSVRCIAR